MSEDLRGKKFNRLTVLELFEKKQFYFNGKKRGYIRYWLCQCECGNTKVIREDSLRQGRIKSCGCLKKEQDKINLGKTIHNQTYTRLYSIWTNLKTRCLNPNSKTYKWYGKRGITICDEWLNNFQSFYDWSYQNGFNELAKRSDCTLDRINVNGNYEPLNCRWVSMKTQNNNRRNTRIIEYRGQEKSLTEWAEILKINRKTLYTRLYRSDWDIEKSFKTRS